MKRFKLPSNDTKNFIVCISIFMVGFLQHDMMACQTKNYLCFSHYIIKYVSKSRRIIYWVDFGL